MKLYVWVDPYDVAFGSSMVFAVAPNLRAARKQVADGKAYSYGEFEQTTPTIKLGKPTRMLNLPCAEWHEWSE